MASRRRRTGTARTVPCPAIDGRRTASPRPGLSRPRWTPPSLWSPVADNPPLTDPALHRAIPRVMYRVMPLPPRSP